MNYYREGKVKRTLTGSEIEPETIRLQAVAIYGDNDAA